MKGFSRALLVVGVAAIYLVLASTVLGQEGAEGSTAEDPQLAAGDEFLRLGTEEGPGGANWQRFERSQTKNLIRSFIPPLLRPAVVEHAFVLPPNAFLATVSTRFATIGGDDFFRDPEPGNEETEEAFRDFEVNRQFLDFDLFYGFDLGRKYLHTFTARLNVPILFYQTEGFVHPNSAEFINVFPEASGSELGDVGLFLKKKFIDQTAFPIQIAGVGAVLFPTGSNDKTFADGGRIKMQRPDPSPGGAGPTPAPPTNMPIPIAMLRSLPQATTPFIFNCDFGRTDPRCGTSAPGGQGVFWRFSDDGRIPAALQPGTGTFSFLTALFFTRVNQQHFSLLGRSAFHWGAAHLFRSEKDGIDPGDQLTVFGSLVKPMPYFEDILALDLSFISFWLTGDSYKGRFFLPTPTDDQGNPVPTWDQATTVTFRERDREPFASGWTGFITPSVIFSPDPSMRFTASSLVRLLAPEVGPAPDFVIRAAFEVTF